MVGGLLRFRGAGEGELSGLKIELERFGRYVRNADREVDVVLLGVGFGGALGPEN